MHDQHEAPGLGHNAPRLRQWQTPHLPHDHVHAEEVPSEPDLDLVEAAFAEGFATASDPTSFLRLAGIPFVAGSQDGGRLGLLRVELDSVTDVGSLTPTLGGGASATTRCRPSWCRAGAGCGSSTRTVPGCSA